MEEKTGVGDLSKNRFLASAGISSGSLVGPQGFRHLLVDIPNFPQLLCVEGIEPDREVHRLQLAASFCSPQAAQAAPGYRDDFG